MTVAPDPGGAENLPGNQAFSVYAMFSIIYSLSLIFQFLNIYLPEVQCAIGTIYAKNMIGKKTIGPLSAIVQDPEHGGSGIGGVIIQVIEA